MNKVDIIKSVLRDLNRAYDGVSINLLGCVLRGGEGPRCSSYVNHAHYGKLPYISHVELSDILEKLIRLNIIRKDSLSYVTKYHLIEKEYAHLEMTPVRDSQGVETIESEMIAQESHEKPHMMSHDESHHVEHNLSKVDFQKEQVHLDQVVTKLMNRIEHIRTEEMYQGVNPSDTADDIDALQTLYLMKETNKRCLKQIKSIEQIIESPYYGRLDLESEANPEQVIYVGKCGFKHKDETIITDWRNRLAQPYYDNEHRIFDIDDHTYKLTRKRRFTIEKSVLLKAYSLFDYKEDVPESDFIIDPFLQQVLLQNRDKRGFSDIIISIQQRQYDIVRQPIGTPSIVQGCAGSGKTMVMFHRISYLLYNARDLNHKMLRIITPSDMYNAFVSNMIQQLDVTKIPISTLSEYYQDVLSEFGINLGNMEQNESIFDQEYLKVIYNQSNLSGHDKIIKEWIMKSFLSIIQDELEAHKEPSMGIKILDRKVIGLTKKLELSAREIGFNFPNPYDDKNRNTFERVRTIINKTHEVIKREVTLSEEIRNENSIKEHLIHKRDTLNEVQNDLLQLIDSKSEFVKIPDKLRSEFHLWEDFVSLAQMHYHHQIHRSEDKLNALEQSKISEERLTQAQNIYQKFESLRPSIDEVVQSKMELNHLKAAHQDHLEIVEAEISRAEKRAETMSREHIEPLTLLNELNRLLSEMHEHGTIRKTAIDPMGMCEGITESVLHPILKRYHIALKDIKSYKHYGYLLLRIASRFRSPELRSLYMFIDEAQDISKGEYELLYQLNPNVVLNLYGDSRQAITKHALKSWNHLETINDIHTLEENYRNPDQIIDLCNRRLGTNMRQLGMPGSPIQRSSFSDIYGLIENLNTNNWAIIYKTADDLQLAPEAITELSEEKHILTVHESKGLEFNTVIVIDKSMNVNEKYIAYTRAMERLVIIE
jgi:DNA helicase IV